MLGLGYVVRDKLGLEYVVGDELGLEDTVEDELGFEDAVVDELGLDDAVAQTDSDMARGWRVLGQGSGERDSELGVGTWNSEFLITMILK